MRVKFTDSHPATTGLNLSTGNAIGVRGLHVVVQVESHGPDSRGGQQARLVPAAAIIPEAATPEGVEPKHAGFPSFPEIYEYFTGQEFKLEGPSGPLTMPFAVRPKITG